MSELLPVAGGQLPNLPPDWAERRRALDPAGSFLVQAPAGSGKTYLLTQRFLRLLGQAEKPEEIVAITFTNAAAAEMRGRVLEELEKAELERAELAGAGDADAESMEVLARKALERSRAMGWRLLEQPGQLRVTTIDAFCRGIALQCPLSWGMLTTLGGRLDPVENPEELYRRAAGRVLGLLEGGESAARRGLEELLLLRDNSWADVETLLVKLLKERNRWFKEFVFLQAVTEEDWARLRKRLEKPFCRAAHKRLRVLARMLDGLPGSREFALELARSTCESPGRSSPTGLAERAEWPGIFAAEEVEDWALALEDAAGAYGDLARFLLTNSGTWRKKAGLNVHHGFPSTPAGKAAKERFGEMVEGLAQEPGLEGAFAGFLEPTPTRYTEDEWGLIRHCFAVMRVAAGELQVVFAEAGAVDFTEVAQMALRALVAEDGSPSDFGLRLADGIRHLLVDEFQDTSRNQHELLARLVGAWPEREGRSVFCVGDPMQSIYGFREAEVELFERLKTHGLEAEEAFRFEFVSLSANFRTEPTLVEDLNGRFGRIFSEDDESGVGFSAAVPARASSGVVRAELHLAFRGTEEGDAERTELEQLSEMVGLIRTKLNGARLAGLEKYRLAVLGRTRPALRPVAEALREAGIGFRSIDLVRLRERVEVLDALGLARALMNPVDRVAWLGVLRGPWCGLSLEELYWLTSADDAAVIATPVPVLLEGRLAELFADGRIGVRGFEAAARVGRVMREAGGLRGEMGYSLGTWVEAVWKALGGEATVGEEVDGEQRENLRLLWRCLDRLPEGEVDLLGAGLDAALEKLFALPDPGASGEFGVQLMTIHKSKGLEFEVVIVPELQAASRNSEPELLSWLERGLAEGDSEELTELLIAPIQTKGGDAGTAKRWVDRVRRAREAQELRRVLYVAATRAREELHLFARPRVTEGKEGWKLGNAAGLLGTAWPAFGEEIEERFAEWVNEQDVDEVIELAAGGALLEMPKTARPTWVRRLPEGFVAPEFGGRAGSGDAAAGIDLDAETEPPYARTEGGLRSRLMGTAIHALLERLSRLRERLGLARAGEALREAVPGVVASVRSSGLTMRAAQALVNEALGVVLRMAEEPVGAWIVAPHVGAETEVGWTGMLRTEDGRERLANLRPDRVFFAAGPGEAEAAWWIIDYKTSHAGGRELSNEATRLEFLSGHRAQHEGQLAAYAQVLRSLRGLDETPVRAGIYYPRLGLFDWWEA